MVTEKTSYAKARAQLRERITGVWADDPLYIDEIIEPGLTERQIAAIRRASAETEKTGLTHFLAIVPGASSLGHEEWAKFTSDLAFSMQEKTGEEQILVLFIEAEAAARSLAYLVTDNGPVIPPAAPELMKSQSDDFIPVELAVPYYLQVLVAAADGTEPPPAPDFRTREIGDRDEDYIERFGLDNGNPDTLVFGATAAAALAATVWVLRRRTRYSWRSQLTTEPTLVTEHRLLGGVSKAAGPLPEPVYPDEETWELYDRGRKIQEALTALTEAHPDWASSVDFSHRHAVFVLVTLDKWVRSQLQKRSSDGQPEPRFCFLFPHHRQGIESHILRQSGRNLTVDLCRACREELRDGHEPARLMVPKSPGSKRAVPYFQRSDAYALSGFGSFQALDEVLLADLRPTTAVRGGK